MPSIGHGISDAVRNHIPLWVDDQLVDILYESYKHKKTTQKEYFKRRLKNSDEWSRKSRKTTNSGFERLYHCKSVDGVTLTVHSPHSDMSANGYVFCVNNIPIAGGKTKLKSTHVTSSLSKDKTNIKGIEAEFVKFSEEELISMRVQMQFGDGFHHLEVEREV